jgi:hypothetical protein
MSTKVMVAMGMLAALALPTPARALPITDAVNPVDIYVALGSTPSPCPSGFDCGPGWLSFTHRITDDGFNIGDVIATANLVIHLTEIVTTGMNHEKYRYDIATQTLSCLNGNCVPNSGVLDSVELNSGSLADLATDGIVRITINSLSGGFLFADSLLTVEMTPHIETLARSSVPLPSTLLLLGGGLVALGAGRFPGKRVV